jgi:hypothetical protein
MAAKANTETLAALAELLGIEVPAQEAAKPRRSTRAKAAPKAASARKGKAASYVPTAERRNGMPTGRMLWALNAAGMLQIRARKGSPLTFGACFDAHPGNTDA